MTDLRVICTGGVLGTYSEVSEFSEETEKFDRDRKGVELKQSLGSGGLDRSDLRKFSEEMGKFDRDGKGVERKQ